MTDYFEWQGRVGQSWAAEWKRTDRSFSVLTDRLLGRASARPIQNALDIGCGAGELSLALARGHTEAKIVGLDISEELIAVSKSRGKDLHNLRFEPGDAANWRNSGTPPDLIVSRHGVMFFPQPAVAFGHLANIAAPDARLVFSCFRSIGDNHWAESIVNLLPASAKSSDESSVSSAAPPPGPFAFSDSDYVTGILSRGGWMDVAFEQVDFPYIAGVGDEAVNDALSYFLRIGPAARAAAMLDKTEKPAFIERLRRYLESRRDGKMVALKASAWIVTARPGRA